MMEGTKCSFPSAFEVSHTSPLTLEEQDDISNPGSHHPKGCFSRLRVLWVMIFDSKQEKEGGLPPALGSIPALGGTRNSWGAGELLLLISSTQCLSQAGDEPDKGPPVQQICS